MRTGLSRAQRILARQSTLNETGAMQRQHYRPASATRERNVSTIRAKTLAREPLRQGLGGALPEVGTYQIGQVKAEPIAHFLLFLHGLFQDRLVSGGAGGIGKNEKDLV